MTIRLIRGGRFRKAQTGLGSKDLTGDDDDNDTQPLRARSLSLRYDAAISARALAPNKGGGDDDGWMMVALLVSRFYEAEAGDRVLCVWW